MVVVKPPTPDPGIARALGGRRTVACQGLKATLSEPPEDVAGCANPPAAAHRRFAKCDDSETPQVRIEMDDHIAALVCVDGSSGETRSTWLTPSAWANS